ncbi:hypothetical protein [Rubrivirga sp.]
MLLDIPGAAPIVTDGLDPGSLDTYVRDYAERDPSAELPDG